MTGALQSERKNMLQTSSEEDMCQYLSEIRRYPLLTQQQERELAKRWAEGDAEALSTLINSNLRLVVSVARKYAGRGVPMPDLIQEGSIGLITAARNFDYQLDYRFSTYASDLIRQRITRALADNETVIRVPLYTAGRMHRITLARAELLNELRREPTVKELADKTGIPPAKVEELLKLKPSTCSLDTPVDAEHESTMEMLVADDEGAEPQAELIRRELKALMERMLGNLNERQRLILRLRFGMDDGICHPREKIGKALGISKERVRQIERQAMDKLKKMGEDLGLEDFLE